VKRALFIVITDNPGGAERVASTLAGELAQHAGWQVHYRVATRREACSFTEAALPHGVTVSYGLFNHYGLAIAALAADLLGRRYDFVFTTHVYTNALLSLLRRLRLIKIGRLISRESTSVFDRFSGRKAVRLRHLYKLYGAQDLLVAQTGYMARHTSPWLSSPAANRLITLPNPVDRTFISKAMGQALGSDVRERLANRMNVLFCGRLMDSKRPDRALEAFAMLVARLPGEPWHLVIVGSGTLEADLHKQAVTLGLRTTYIFWDFSQIHMRSWRRASMESSHPTTKASPMSPSR
jgi:glycosyltransferase involved in cell wall biosynthesis